MGKCFRFLSCLGLASVCTASYGTPYPSLEDIQQHFSSLGTHAMFVEAFEEVREKAERFGFEELKLFGESKKCFFELPKARSKGCLYNPKDFLHYCKKFDERFCGFLLCSIDDLAVFNDFTLEEAVKTRANALAICDKQRSELVKVCKVLLSEAFAKRLLTDALVRAFYENREYSDSFFDIHLNSYGSDEKTNILQFDAEYVHQFYAPKAEAEKYVFRVRFRFNYDLDRHDFGPGDVRLELLQFDDFPIDSELDAKVMRLRENPWKGRLNKNVCGIKTGKKAFIKRNKNLDFEQSEEKKFIVKKRKIQKQNFSGKRPRSFDSSEDEKSEENFKKKKE